MKQNKPRNNPTASAQYKPIEPAPINDIPTWWGVGLLFVCIVVLFLFRLNFVNFAMERDEGIYIYFGKLILEGKVPYNDFYEIRFPGIFYMYALVVKLFGYSAKGVGIGFGVIISLSSCFVYFITLRLVRLHYISLIAAVSFFVLSFSPAVVGFTRQSEHLVNLFFIASLFVLCIREKPHFALTILSGLLACMAILIKPNAVFFAPVVLAFLLLLQVQSWSISAVLNKIFFWIMGFLLPILFFGAILFFNNALGNFYTFAIEEAGKYATGIGYELSKMMLTNSVKNIYSFNTYFILCYIATLFSLYFMPIPARVKYMVIVLAMCSLLTITPGYRFYNHYFIMLMPSIAILSSLIYWWVQAFFPSLFSRTFLIPLLLFTLVIIIHFAKNKDYYSGNTEEETIYNAYGENPFNEAKLIGAFLKPNCSKQDKIALIGSEPELYVYTGLNSATRHDYFSYLMSDTTLTTQVGKWQREYFDDLIKNKPKFVVFNYNKTSLNATSKSDMRILGNCMNYLNATYTCIAWIDLKTPFQPQYFYGEQSKNFTLQYTQSQYISVLQIK